MQEDRINKLIGELIRLSAEYSAEEFESGAKIIKNAINVKHTEKVALTLAGIKKEMEKTLYIPKQIKKRGIVDDIRRIEIRTRPSNNLEKKFPYLLKKIAFDKKRFNKTMSVRLFLKDIFGHEIGKIKDGRERIVNYAIREYNKLPKSKQIQIYNKLNVISAPISEDFEGYSRIIKRE